MATNPEEEARRIIEDGKQEIDNTVRSLNDATQAAAAKMGTAAGDINVANNAINSSVAEAEAGFRSLGQSAINFSRALTSGENSMAKYNGAIDAAGTGLSMLASAAFGPLGMVLGLAVKAFTTLMGATLNQSDKIIDNFNKLSDLGAAAQFSTSELEGMFNQAGFNTFNGQSQMIVKTITSLGSDLTKLGATSGDGIKTFTQLASFNKDNLADQQNIRNQFANLGFSQEKLLNAQASFMKEQGSLGLGRKQVDTKLVNQSLDYTKNLATLSALTGESADAIKESRAKDLEDFGFNVTLRQLGDSEDGNQKRELIQTMSTVIGKHVDPASQAAFRNVIAVGAATSAEAIALSTRTNGQFVHWVNDFKTGKLSPEGFINKLNESGDAMLQSMGAALKASGEVRNMLAIGTQTVENTAKNFAEGAFDATRKEIEKNAQKIDPYVGFANTIKNTTDTLAKMMDEFLKLIRDPLMDVFKALMLATKELALAFIRSPMAKKLGIDLSGIEFMLESDEKVKSRQANLLKEIEEKQRRLSDESRNPVVDDYGRTPEVDRLKSQLNEQKQLLQQYQKESKRRNVEVVSPKEVFQRESIKDPRRLDRPSQPTQNPTPPALNPNQSAPEAPPQKFKFGGVTGMGSSDVTEKLTGGGVFDGPMSGYRKQLPKGKNFAVVPLPSGDTIPVSFKNDMMTESSMPADMTGNKANPLTNMSQISDMMSEMINVFKQTDEETETISNTTVPMNNRRTSSTLESITGKLDTLLDRIRLNNNLQTELLDHARG